MLAIGLYVGWLDIQQAMVCYQMKHFLQALVKTSYASISSWYCIESNKDTCSENKTECQL